MLTVPRHIAILKKTEHRYQPDQGYLQMGPLPEPHEYQKRGKGSECDPPEGTRDNSVHFLKAPGGEVTLLFTWVESEHAWERFGGHRLAFPARYLSYHGWKYIEPATL